MFDVKTLPPCQRGAEGTATRNGAAHSSCPLELGGVVVFERETSRGTLPYGKRVVTVEGGALNVF